jgi:hypothetical protein
MTHIMSCQYRYFPWLVQGNGLSPGEEIETLWSKLRQLWARIREMGLGTREDAISDAIEQINRIVLEELPEILIRQLHRAETAKFLASRELADLRKIPGVRISDDDLKDLDLTTFGAIISVDWKVRYVRILLEYNHLTTQVEMIETTTPEFNKAHTQLRTLKRILQDFEERYRIDRYQGEQVAKHENEALLQWIRDIKNKLRTCRVLEKYYADREKTYRKRMRNRNF